MRFPALRTNSLQMFTAVQSSCLVSRENRPAESEHLEVGNSLFQISLLQFWSSFQKYFCLSLVWIDLCKGWFFYCSALKTTKYKEKSKYPNPSANCSSKKILSIRKKTNVRTVPPKKVQSIFTKSI